tara:strand:- start:724 stop:1116 length:393 start_codon:yes stop_codon:yes gene_type:complete
LTPTGGASTQAPSTSRHPRSPELAFAAAEAAPSRVSSCANGDAVEDPEEELARVAVEGDAPRGDETEHDDDDESRSAKRRRGAAVEDQRETTPGRLGATRPACTTQGEGVRHANDIVRDDSGVMKQEGAF